MWLGQIPITLKVMEWRKDFDPVYKMVGMISVEAEHLLFL